MRLQPSSPTAFDSQRSPFAGHPPQSGLPRGDEPGGHVREGAVVGGTRARLVLFCAIFVEVCFVAAASLGGLFAHETDWWNSGG